MKLLKVLALSLLLSGCGGEIDFYVGPTPVILEDGAREQIPCDFAQVLRETHREIENRFDRRMANKILSTPVRLYPDYATPKSKFDYSAYLNGLKEGGEVHVRILGPSILTSALLHEQINHCLCNEAYNDMNASHKNEDCKREESEITAIVREKTTSERMGRCADESWR